ncbi:hypothetical protein PAMP_013557 [Pampus punctatissimus]
MDISNYERSALVDNIGCKKDTVAPKTNTRACGHVGINSSRPPGFPAIGSSLKVTLQSGHADVASLAVGMKPAPTPPPPLSLPPTTHSTLLPPSPPPQRHSSYPCWARSAPRSTPLAASGAAVKKLYPTSLINNGPFLMQTL